MWSKEKFNTKYTAMIDHPVIRDYYGNNNFYNIGYWATASDQIEASKAIVGKIIEEHGGITSDSAILDAGAGIGGAMQHIQNQFGFQNIKGININPTHVNRFNSGSNLQKMVLMDACAIDFPEESFDLIYSIDAVGHFPSFDNFIKGAFKHLKSQGQLIFCDAIFSKSHEGLEWMFPSNEFLNESSIQENLQNAGFKNIVIQDLFDSTWQPYLESLKKAAKDAFILKEHPTKIQILQKAYSQTKAMPVEQYLFVKAEKI